MNISSSSSLLLAILVLLLAINASSAKKPPTWQQLANLYGMEAHPEGGYWSQTYVSSGTVPVSVLAAGGFSSPPATRTYSTAIYYLLRRRQADKSHFHMLLTDEIWHFYLGGQLTLVILNPADGSTTVVKMGQDVLHGEVVQYTVPAKTWFAAYPSKGDYTFVGNTNAPGFAYEDWTLGQKATLLAQFPNATNWINLLAYN